MRCYTLGKFLPVSIALFIFLSFSAVSFPAAAAQQAAKKKPVRQIEEVVVTAEKVKSTVSDTAISISAFNSQMIKDFGLQNANDMINYLPATTRDTYDIRIRGVGKNFRALGGDAGVATYYNGVFSPDFLIAATESGLWDLKRIEVLRGPQGTLYGKNAVGGAINYITNDPTWDWTGKVRTVLGNRRDRELYAVVSGPLIANKVAIRLLAVKRLKNGNIDGIDGSPATDSTDDRNDAISLTWDITDSITFDTRTNDRLSNRVMPSPVLINAGPGPMRKDITEYYAYGLRPVTAATPGAMAFTDPAGGTVYGTFVRPGEDISSDFEPNGAYQQAASNALMAGATLSDPNNTNLVNDDGVGPCRFPYTLRNCNNERFQHQSNQTQITWQINNKTRLHYIFGYTDYKYTYNIDEDFSNAQFDKSRITVDEDVQQKSHELQLFWGLGDNFTATSGAFYYDEIRQQDYSITDTVPRFTAPTDYGSLNTPTIYLGGASFMQILEATAGIVPHHVRLWDAPLGNRTELGLWQGDTRGDRYHHFNTMHRIDQAFYTQGTYHFNDNWDLVLGLRYAKDKKTGTEVRTGYSEVTADQLVGFDAVLPVYDGGLPVGALTGLTTLGALNIAMGNATWSGNPADPLTPTCALTDATCTHPLRLQGVPISYSGYIMASNTWSDTNYRIDVNWTPNDNALMYFSITTGYRAGGFALGIAGQSAKDANGNDVPGQYGKETVTSFETGYKGKLLDNTMTLDMALYHYVYKNYQDSVDAFDALTNSTSNVVVNAPRALFTGFEMETMWLATDSLTLGGNYSYTRTKYDANYYTAVLTNPTLPVSLLAGGDATTRPDLFQANLNGNDLKQIPRNKATVWASYLWSTSVGEITARATYAYTGKYWDQGYENAYDLIPSRYRADASVTWQDAQRHWTVRAFVDNLTNKHALRSIGEGTETTNWRQSGIILQPRFFGLDVTYNFTPQ